MRTFLFPLLLGLSACSPGNLPASSAGTHAMASRTGTRPAPGRVTPATSVAPTSRSNPSAGADADSPFAGVWEDCQGADSPDICSRYVLAQRGPRICGTWEYYATGNYFGHVVATMRSPKEARRIFLCGRPGSETSKECEEGWEVADKPLRLCGEKLGDLDSERGGCYADFRRVRDAHGELDALQNELWMQACLAGDPAEAAR